MFRGFVIKSTLIVVASCLSLVAHAMAESPKAVNVPPGPLVPALESLSKQTTLELIYEPKQLTSFRTAGVSGVYTARDAVERLLKGTPLQIEVDPSGAMAIVPQGAQPPGGSQGKTQNTKTQAHSSTRAKEGKSNSGSSGPFQLAEADQGLAAAASTLTHESQKAAYEAPGLQEVVVTAQKYRQREFDVPISMTVIGEAELRKFGITDLDNLQFFVPGLYVDNDGTALRITIQGISNVFGQAALVGTYLDEADVTSQGFFGLNLDTYDLTRVEVLKGPQGTLYGDGSLGGTIRYITNKPVLDQVQMDANVTALFDQYGAPESRVEAVINAPVVEGVFGLRAAGELDQGGGWIDQPAANRNNINSRNLADVRLEGRWRPRTDLTIDAMDVIHRETSGPYTNENPAGVYTQVFNLTTTPSLTDNYNISNVTLTYSPGPFTILNSSTYFTHYNNERNFGGSFQLTPPPSPMFQDYWTSAPNTDESLSDELRVSDSGAGRWRWTLGAFFKRLDNSSPLFYYYFGLPGPPGTSLPTPPYSSYDDIYSNSKSIFGDSNYRLPGGLVLGVGVRYFKDKQDALLLGDTSRERATFTSTDPRFYARYSLSGNVNIYASAAKGFRSGGFNGDGFPEYQPEHVWNYDLGTKMRMRHRIRIDADIFLSNYNAYQIVGVPPPPAPPQDVTHNAGEVRIKGIEAAVAWSPARQWTVSVNGDYIDGRFVKVSVMESSYNVGDPMDDVPRYQITGSVEREFQWRKRSGFARLDYTQRARATFRNRSIGPWYYSQSDYMYLLGFRAGINWSSRLAIGVLAQNLLNNRGFIGSDSMEAYALRQQPRTFGVYFNVNVE